MNEPTVDEREAHRERAFLESLPSLSLTELQDVFEHLDRIKYPDRIEPVRQQMDDRIDQLGTPTSRSSTDVAGSFRRLWGSILDVFISVFPFLLYFGYKMISASSGGGGRGGRGGFRGRGGGSQTPEESWMDQVIDYVTSPEAVWGTIESYGPWILAFMAYRALYLLPQLVRSGSSPGMREVGIRVVSNLGEAITWRQVALRFSIAYGLGFVTLGVSHLWSLWGAQGQTLFDRFSGTRVIRAPRRWEKPLAQRLLED